MISSPTVIVNVKCNRYARRWNVSLSGKSSGPSLASLAGLSLDRVPLGLGGEEEGVGGGRTWTN